MSNLPAAQQTGSALSTSIDHKTVVARVQTIQRVMKDVMKVEVHYGIIPGTGNKYTLLKPGSEVLLSAFQIAVEPEVEVIRDGNHITYTVRCFGRHMGSGVVVGIGVGEASTSEEKYAWRAAVCQEEYDATPDDRRREKWFKGYPAKQNKPEVPAHSVLQVRTNPNDMANTVLKMAKKRAQIDLTLTALGASDIFAQDLEEYDEDDPRLSEQVAAKRKYETKERTGASGPQAGFSDGPATAPQVRLLNSKLGHSGKKPEDLLAHFKVEKIEDIKKSQVNDAIAWIDAK